MAVDLVMESLVLPWERAQEEDRGDEVRRDHGARMAALLKGPKDATELLWLLQDYLSSGKTLRVGA